MPAWQLAQYNVALAVGPADSPEMRDFLAMVPAVNAAAESSPGFVWRLKEDEVASESGPFLLSNLSVWEDIETLRAFTYKNAHVHVFRNRARWFAPTDQANSVLWWVPAGHQPAMSEGDERLNHLRVNGAGPTAFDFAHSFPPPPPSTPPRS